MFRTLTIAPGAPVPAPGFPRPGVDGPRIR